MCLSTLDIIVEGAVLLPVLPEKPESVVVPKVFKLDQCVLPVFVHHSLHELVNQVIVRLRTVPLLIQAHVERILEESLIAAQGTNISRLMTRTASRKQTFVLPCSQMLDMSWVPTSLFVPTSITTGRHFSGLMPAQAVYRQSFPTGMPIPKTPRSPNPKIRSPSVTTTACAKREKAGSCEIWKCPNFEGFRAAAFRNSLKHWSLASCPG